MMKSLGIRAHDYGKMTSSDLAQAVQKSGLGSVQLALNKAIIGIENIDDPMAEDELLRIGMDFRKADVAIAVLGCYLNYAHPNGETRKANLQTFRNHIRYAKLLDARVVGTETGSCLADYRYTSENHSHEAYKVFAGSLANLLQAAEDMHVDLAVEGVWDHIIYSNERMDRLIRDMASENLKVILDPVNLLNVNNYKKHDDIVKQAFDLFGDRIQIIHAKDYRVSIDGIEEISHGSGIYDYDFLTKVVSEASWEMDILLENADVSNIQEIRKLFGGDVDL